MLKWFRSRPLTKIEYELQASEVPKRYICHLPKNLGHLQDPVKTDHDILRKSQYLKAGEKIG